MHKALSKKEIKEIILTELPKLIKKDVRIREFILQLAQERFADKKKTEDRFEALLKEIKSLREEGERRWEETRRWWNENLKKWKENEKRWQETQAEWNKRWEEANKRWEETRAEWNKRWEENQKVINRMLEEIRLLRERQEAESKRIDRKFDITIGALGARWGLRAEGSFRNAIKGILEESFPVKVERYHERDEDGVVFGRPDQIELDLIIKNGEVIVAEIKSSISKSDVAIFIKKLEFFIKKEGRPVSRKILISPMIDSSAKEFAESSGIEIYSYPEELTLQGLENN